MKRYLRKRSRRMILMILVTAGALMLFFICTLLFWSQGRLENYLNHDGDVLKGSVSEITRVKINGIKQGMIIKGKSDQNPVLLFLHGGPGNPEYVLAKNQVTELEEAFTVCWWEQRGSGMSYTSAAVSKNVTLEEMISDTVEVTNYLRKRFDQDKIYIMGHSWGSFLGINVAVKYPEFYTAYLGIGQVTNLKASEKLSYDYMVKTLRARGDEKDLKRLTAYDIDDLINTERNIPEKYLMLRSQILGKLGNGLYHKPPSQFKDVLLPFLQASEYRLADKYGYLMGSLYALSAPISKDLAQMNLMVEIPEITIPVYFFHGKYDRQVSYELSKDYFDMLTAPEKHFYNFDHSAHSPFIEEPERFMKIIREDIL